jgi:hypothetical protein
MKSKVIWRSGKLVRDGAKDIYVTVHRHLSGCNPSLCNVIEDGNGMVIGGDTGSVEQMFDDQVAKHPGYIVTQRRDFLAV